MHKEACKIGAYVSVRKEEILEVHICPRSEWSAVSIVYNSEAETGRA